MREGWVYKTFGEVGSFLRGKSIQKADFTENGMPCIHYGQIHTKFGVSVDKHLSEIPIEVYNKSIIASHGDVIIALTSEDVEGSCKSTAWIGDYDIAVGSDAAVYKHNLNSKFVVYYLHSNSFYDEKQKYARGFKVTHIKTTDIAKIPIPVPPLSEQQRIVSELDLLSSIIEKKKAQLKEYDQLAQSIFYDMFGDPVTNEKGWEVKKLGDCCKNCDSQRKPITAKDRIKGTIPYYGASGVVDFVKDYIFDGEYLLISEDGANLIIRSTPIAFRIKGKTWVNNHAHVLQFDALFKQIFMEYSINLRDISSIVTGCAQPKLTQAAMNNINIPYPPLPLQQSFASKIEAIERQKSLIQQSITEAETLFNSRMDYWFS
jgi:type I restriction enzyme S subunit